MLLIGTWKQSLGVTVKIQPSSWLLRFDSHKKMGKSQWHSSFAFHPKVSSLVLRVQILLAKVSNSASSKLHLLEATAGSILLPPEPDSDSRSSWKGGGAGQRQKGEKSPVKSLPTSPDHSLSVTSRQILLSPTISPSGVVHGFSPARPLRPPGVG